jgi:hypothetical protein
MRNSKSALGQILQTHIPASFLHPFEAPSHRRTRRDLVEPIAMLPDAVTIPPRVTP